MWGKTMCGIVLVAMVCLAGCDSGGSESEQERERADSPAAQLVRHFYEAANDADGTEACGLLTDTGIRTVVRVKTRADCVNTVDGFQAGSFEADEGEPGTIRAVVYVGPATRFVVVLDDGGELSVLQQNLETSSSDVHQMEGKRVRLAWRADVEFEIKEGK